MIQISKFLFGAENEPIISDEETDPLEPILFRQRLMKDFGVIDFLMDLIYLPFKN